MEIQYNLICDIRKCVLVVNPNSKYLDQQGEIHSLIWKFAILHYKCSMCTVPNDSVFSSPELCSG